MASGKEFRTLLFSLAHHLNQQEVDALVWIHRLPKEYSGKSAATVLQYMEQQGIFSHSKPEELIEVLKGIKKNDLCKQVKEFSKAAKKSRKNSSSGCSSDTAKDQPSSLNFDSAEEGVLLVKDTLDVLEESVKSCNVKRIEEVYNEAKQAADHLLMVLKRANGLARTLLANSNQQTRPKEIPPAPPGSMPMTLAAMCAEQRAQRFSPPQGKTPPQGTSSKPVVRLSRSQSERCIRLALPSLPFQGTQTHKEEEEEEEEDDIHDYDEPYTFHGGHGGHTLPRKTSDIVKVLQHSPPSRERAKNGLVLRKPIQSQSGFSSPSSSVPKQSPFIGSSPPSSSVLKQSSSITPSQLASPVLKQPPTPGSYPCNNIQQIRESLRKTKEKYGPQAHPISVARAADTEVGYCTDSSSTGDSGFEEVVACVRSKNLQHRPVPKPRNRKSPEDTTRRGSQQSDYSPDVEEEESGTMEPEYMNVREIYHR